MRVKTERAMRLRGTAAFSGVNLLICLAIGLCGLVAWQWVRETRLFDQVGKLEQARQSLVTSTNEMSKTIELLSKEVTRVEKQRKDELADLQLTNKYFIRELRAATNRLVQLSNRVESFKSAFEMATNNLARANQTIQAQNKQTEEVRAQVEAIKEKIANYNDVARQLKKVTEEYNALMTDRNKVVDELNKTRQPANEKQEKEKK